VVSATNVVPATSVVAASPPPSADRGFSTSFGRQATGAGLPFHSGPPLVCDEAAATYERASDEHSRLAVSAATNRLALGDKIRLIPGHCDPTVNLYDRYVCIRTNRVEQLWPIAARGAVY
jgi:D-serine deaminase-like pyridoxal phosphate-dependent protein